jgi:hypothetical protein
MKLGFFSRRYNLHACFLSFNAKAITGPPVLSSVLVVKEVHVPGEAPGASFYVLRGKLLKEMHLKTELTPAAIVNKGNDEEKDRYTQVGAQGDF